jgi:uncharacterized membrane protein YhaH (DUF805 family)
MIMPFKRYADFSGRSQRQEFWMFFLLNWIIALPLFIFIGMQGEVSDKAKQAGKIDPLADTLVSGGVVVLLLYLAAIIVPLTAVAVRRFHDQDKSGWLLFLTFIPYVGLFIMIGFMVVDGTAGPNRYGDDPKGRFVENQELGDIDHFSTIDYGKSLEKPPARIVS